MILCWLLLFSVLELFAVDEDLKLRARQDPLLLSRVSYVLFH